MEQHAFRTAVSDLYHYYKRASFPTEKSYQLWYKKVEEIPGEAIEWIVNNIQDNNESLPSNIPKAFRFGWYLYKKVHPGKVKKSYDSEEDPSFPQHLLWRGFRILERKNSDEFEKYCERVHMPNNDRLRVLSKYNSAYNTDEVVSELFESV